MSKEDRLKEVHDEALKQFDAIISAVKEERDLCLSDRRFASIAGAQWEGDLGDQFENKPKFEVNKVHLSVMRIISEYRNNRISGDFVSKDGEPNDVLSDTCDKLFRADEQDSGADEAYDMAFEEAVMGGFGAWRLRACYEDEGDPENERQRIRFEPIPDADSTVFFDLAAKRQDKSDAKHCFVLTGMPSEVFEDKYDESLSEWTKPVTQSEFDWVDSGIVYVAEYYQIEEAPVIHSKWANLVGDEEKHTSLEFEEDPALLARLEAVGTRKVSERKIKHPRVHKYILCGDKVLEDCGFIAGQCIPVIPVYGKRWVVDGVERCMGHVRLAKDAQRLANMQRSKLGEISAMSPVEKPIFTPEQILGQEHRWADDNVKNYPFLVINAVRDLNGNPQPMGPIGYTKAPNVPPAMAALLQITETDIRDILGNQEQGEKVNAAVSGKAMEIISNRLDMQTFIYISNFSKGMKRCGEVWLSMAREIYVEEGRKMKAVGKDMKASSVVINQLVDDGGDVKRANNLSDALFDVAVTVGPSSASAKAATVRALTGMIQMTEDPETKSILGSMAMLNMEGEGIEDVRSFFRKKLLAAGVVTPTEEEAKDLATAAQNAKPSAQDEYLKAASQEAAANAQKAQADTGLKMAQTRKVTVETAQIAGEIQMDANQQALDIMDKFKPEAPELPDISVVRVANPQLPLGNGSATV